VGRSLALAPGLPHLRKRPVTDATVVLSARARRVMIEQALAATDGNETGGVLLGDSSANAAEVRHAGTPGPAAVRSPTRFNRDREYAQRFADACYAADGSLWIGEWHTHPGGQPVPSDLDLATYLALLHDAGLHLDVFVAVIVTTSDESLSMAAWLCDTATVRLGRVVLSRDGGSP
jgi:integrative and conjugative element protein (TIGR02256 family)